MPLHKYKKPTLAQLKLFHYRILQSQGQDYLALPKQKEATLEAIIQSLDQYVFGQELYPTLCDKAIYLLMGIDKSQAFPDGNKRVALSAFEYFLNLNRASINADISQRKKEMFSLAIATNEIDKIKAVNCCIRAIRS